MKIEELIDVFDPRKPHDWDRVEDGWKVKRVTTEGGAHFQFRAPIDRYNLKSFYEVKELDFRERVEEQFRLYDVDLDEPWK